MPALASEDSLGFIKVRGDGVTLAIKVKPRSAKIGPLGVSSDNNELKWGVNSAPVDGEANKELERGIAKFFALAGSNVQIINGLTSRSKVVLLKGADLNKLLQGKLRSSIGRNHS